MPIYPRYLVLLIPALVFLATGICGCRFTPTRPTVQQSLDQGQRLAESDLPQPYESLKPAFTLKKPPAEGDWPALYPEPSQSFSAYLKSRPRRPDSRRSIIYIQPLRFPPDPSATPPLPESLLEETREFCEAMTGLEVRLRPALTIEELPSRARLENPDGSRQILSPYLLAEILTGELPPDGFGIIGLTTADLSPGAGYPFVYGQSSLRYRVAIVSIFRQGDPSSSPEELRRRHLRTVGHELGHLFGLRHCNAYECLMNGTANREEADKRPFFLCPVCLQKLCWNLDLPPARHLQNLRDFFSRLPLEAEARRAEQLIRHLPSPAKPDTNPAAFSE